MAANDQTIFMPTKEACEDYKLRRFHSDYDSLTSNEANSGVFSDALTALAGLTENAIGVDIPGFGPPGIENQKTFLAGPQFKNKPGNILQEPLAQFSLGLYNGPQSSWWSAKRTQNQPDGGKDELSDARTTNSVWISARKNTPYKIKTPKRNGDGIIVSEYDYGSGSTSSEELWKMNILPNWNHEEGLEFDHKHEWGAPDDMFTKLLGSVGGMIAGANRMAERLDSAINGNAPALSLLKTDIAATYQDTNRLEITIPFTLFTKNNFYRDIYYPIMTLNSLTHPRRATLEETTKELNNLVSGAINKAGGVTSALGLGDIKVDNGDLGAQQAQDFLSNFMPGFRVFASEPPAYFSIEHSAGIFKFDNCAVTNFKYEYKGPWVTTTNLPQGSDPSGTIDNNANGGLGGIATAVRAPANKFWEFWKTEKDVLDLTWQRSKMTYPLIAECSITFKLLDPIFGDDWLNQLGTYQKLWAEELNSSTKSAIPPLDPRNIGGFF